MDKNNRKKQIQSQISEAKLTQFDPNDKKGVGNSRSGFR
jgi:hypothetical protein